MKKILLIGVAVILLCLSNNAVAQYAFWNGTTDDWFSNNWVYYIPTASDTAYINNGGTVEITSGNPEAGVLYIGSGTGNSGSVIHSAGSASFRSLIMSDSSGGQGYYSLSGTGDLSVSANFHMYNNSTFEQTGGSFNAQFENVSAGSVFNHTAGTNTTTYQSINGEYNLSGTGELIVNGNHFIYGNMNQGAGTSVTVTNQIIYSGGTFTQTGGSNTVNQNQGVQGAYQIAGDNTVGFSQDITGTFTQTSGNNIVSGVQRVFGTFTQTGGINSITGHPSSTPSTIYQNIRGIFTQNAGVNTVNGGQAIDGNFIQNNSSNSVSGNQYVGYSYGSAGTVTQTGGSNNASDQYVGYGSNSNGTVTQIGGSNDVSGILSLGSDIGSTGTYRISGGTMSVSDLQVGLYGRGNLEIDDASSDISIFNSLIFGFDSSLTAVAGSKIKMNGASLDNWNTDPYDLSGFNNLNMAFNGGTGTSLVEVAGTDVGSVWSGSGYFAFDIFTVGDTSAANVQLVDNHTNMGGTEALYAISCIFGAGSTLDLNGINLYCNSITDNGATIFYNGGQLIHSTTVVPEPISSTLFIVGSATLGFRRFRKKFKI